MCRKIVIYYIFDIISVIMCNGKFYTEVVSEDIVDTCIADVIKDKHQSGFDIAIINNDAVTNHLIQRIHETGIVKLYIKDDGEHVNISPSIFIIYAQNTTSFENMIDHLDKDWYRKPEALHIIILKDNNYSEHNLMPVFKTLWEYHIIHTLIIAKETNENALIYSYLPYAEGNCGQNYNNTIKLSDCVSAKEINVLELLHEHEKPVLRNCELKVGTHNYPPIVVTNPQSTNKYAIGIEIVLLDILAAIENITLNYIYYPENLGFGQVSDNYTVDGVLEKLYKNEVDVVIGAFALNSQRAIFFDYICSHFAYQDSFVTIVPSTGLWERWKTVYIVFKPLVWLLILILFLFNSLMLSRNHYDTVVVQIKSSELLNLFGNFVQNVKLRLRHDHFKNLIIVHWLWFAFLMNCFYQTRLTSFTTFRIYKPQLNKYMSLSNYNFTPCFALDIAPFMKSSGQVPIINEQYLVADGCETTEMSLDAVADTQMKYTVVHYYRYLLWLTYHPKKEEKVHLMKEKLYGAIYAIFVKRGFPLRQEFSLKMLSFVENGFVDVIKQFHRIRKNNFLVPDPVGSFKISTLKLVDLIVPFSILMIGLAFALVIFAIELSKPPRE